MSLDESHEWYPSSTMTRAPTPSVLDIFLEESLALYSNGTMTFAPTFASSAFLRTVLNDEWFKRWLSGHASRCDQEYLSMNPMKFIDDHLRLWIPITLLHESMRSKMLDFIATVPVCIPDAPSLPLPLLPPLTLSPPLPLSITTREVYKLCTPTFMIKLGELFEKNEIDPQSPCSFSLFVITQLRQVQQRRSSRSGRGRGGRGRGRGHGRR